MDVLSSVRHSIHNNTASTSYKIQYDRFSYALIRWNLILSMTMYRNMIDACVLHDTLFTCTAGVSENNHGCWHAPKSRLFLGVLPNYYFAILTRTHILWIDSCLLCSIYDINQRQDHWLVVQLICCLWAAMRIQLSEDTYNDLVKCEPKFVITYRRLRNVLVSDFL